MKYWIKNQKWDFSWSMAIGLFATLFIGIKSVEAQKKTVYIYGDTNADVVEVLNAKGVAVKFGNSINEVINKAPKRSAVLLLSVTYPEVSQSFHLDEAMLRRIKEKGLKVFMEYPSAHPGVDIAHEPKHMLLERAVITSDKFGERLPALSLLGLNDRYVLEAKDITDPLLIMAKVVGFDKAEYGLENTEVWPLLFEKDGVLLATTRLSNFITGRFGPAEHIKHVWNYILNWAMATDSFSIGSPSLTVQPMYPKDFALPADAGVESVRKGVEWFYKGRFFIDPSWQERWLKYQGDGTMPVGPPNPYDIKNGDGSWGIIEGHASTIYNNGRQQYRYWLRSDVQGEAAMALSAAGSLLQNEAYKEQGRKLADFVLNHPKLWYGDNSPDDLRGLLGWSYTQPHIFYGDDNARAILGIIGASAYLDEGRWDKQIIENILANFRTTGKNGFRGPSLDAQSITNEGWQHFNERDIINPHPHFESWLWACYLWLYDKTGYQPLLDKTKRAIAITMERYPNWNWTNGIQQERARMILPLAWLVRVEDTPQHREWLDTMVTEIIKQQDASGAIREELGDGAKGMFGKTRSNAEYGLHEAPLIYENGDPVADMLYTCNFAFFGLNEAARATGDTRYQQAAKRLSDFLIRIQVNSDKHPGLDGAWFRAFDFNRWEYWASNADAGWGAWSTLTGWIQSWIIATQAQIQENTSFWEVSAGIELQDEFQPIKDDLLSKTKWKIENGHFYEDGKRKFLKIAKPLRNFANHEQVNKLIEQLDVLKSKNYDVISLNCYWHHFDIDGDGIPDRPLEPLAQLIDSIYEKGMYPALSVETYSVGGGSIPTEFWQRHPDAYAINCLGERVNDTEYGFNTAVVSIFNEGYRNTTHTFIKSLANAIDTKKIIYFETTVEPQYMGEVELCYSDAARAQYQAWLAENQLDVAENRMPKGFPIPESFLRNPVWNKFRAQFLAKWINGDAEAYREVAGRDAYVAVDFLDADESTTRRRNGDPIELLSHLSAPNIIQVNWHWDLVGKKPNQKAYDRVKQVNERQGRNWAISEHMTINGSDFNGYSEDQLKTILRNTIAQGTGFGWEFVNVANDTSDPFAVYNDDWTPKRVMRVVDYHWDDWIKEVLSSPYSP